MESIFLILRNLLDLGLIHFVGLVCRGSLLIIIIILERILNRVHIFRRMRLGCILPGGVTALMIANLAGALVLECIRMN